MKRLAGARPSRPLLRDDTGAGGTPALQGILERGHLGRIQRCGGGTPALQKRRGLSLIEVLLALTIMLLALVAITQLVNIGSDRGIEARFHVRGTRLAQAKMAEVEAGAIAVDGGGSGTFDPDDPEWSWSVESEPQSAPYLYLVTVRVSRDLRGKPFEVTLSQMILDPTVQGTAAQAERPPEQTTDGTTGTTTGTGTSR